MNIFFSSKRIRWCLTTRPVASISKANFYKIEIFLKKFWDFLMIFYTLMYRTHIHYKCTLTHSCTYKHSIWCGWCCVRAWFNSFFFWRNKNWRVEEKKMQREKNCPLTMKEQVKHSQIISRFRWKCVDVAVLSCPCTHT